MRRLVLKQEIPGKLIPKIMRSFLLSEAILADNDDLKEIKNLFSKKMDLTTDSQATIDVGMYIDDNSDPFTFDNITIIVKLFREGNYENGLRNE